MLDSGGTEGGNPQLFKAMQAQKAAAQAGGLGGLGNMGGGSAADPHSGGQSGGQLPVGLGGMGGGHTGGHAPAAPAPPPREVSSIPDELVKRPLKDMFQEVKSWFNPNKWFGINTEDSPEDKSKKQQLHGRYQQLTAEQQQYAQKRLQREQERKQRMEQEQQMEQQQKQAEEANSIAPPSSPHKGPADLNAKSSAQRMSNVVQQNRQSFNKVSSSG